MIKLISKSRVPVYISYFLLYPLEILPIWVTYYSDLPQAWSLILWLLNVAPFPPVPMMLRSFTLQGPNVERRQRWGQRMGIPSQV